MRARERRGGTAVDLIQKNGIYVFHMTYEVFSILLVIM